MKRTQIYLASLLVFMILGAFLVSCSSECTGEITDGGKTYTAKAKNPEDAKRFTCNKYCLATDGKCDAMYNIWVNSPIGKAAGSPPKMKALSKNKKLLDCVTIECADRCLADIKAGKLEARVNCK